ncbi:MAG: hypothetical protein PHS79_02840 [Patescibacteria group bacterium]|nr:hypothetical protein [Patescibacteria group bacterium]
MNSKAIKVILSKNPQWPLVIEIARRVKTFEGRALIVGGAVRDSLMASVLKVSSKCPSNVLKESDVKDFDMEVFGLNKSVLKRILLDLSRFRTFQDVSGRSKDASVRFKDGIFLKEVGQQFGVFNLGGVEIAIPRTDSRTRPGMGRKPKVISQPDLTFEQASKRRDLTINAMGYDPLTGELMDAHGGQKDLKSGLLRAVDEKSFGDDPLRVLRVMQFAGRFGFKVDPKTIELCRKISLKHLAKERVGEEWTKLLLKAPKPSVGLEAGRQLGIFARLHPSLAKMSQSDWKVTKIVVDHVAVLCYPRIRQAHALSLSKGASSTRPGDPIKVFLLVALCHRMRKTDVTAFLRQINCSNKVTNQVVAMLKVMVDMKSKKLSDEFVRRLAFQIAQVDEALTLKDIASLVEQIVGRARTQKVTSIAKKLHVLDTPPVNLLTGKDLLCLGVQPGKKMGELLQKAFDEQLKGRFDDKNHKPQKKLVLEWTKRLYEMHD